MKRTLLLLAILSLAILGCPPKEPGPRGGGVTAPGNEILIGEYGSMSGPQATFGQTTHEGITLAAEEINAAGGIKGRKIKILVEDDRSQKIEAANAVTKLIAQSNVVAILGEVASSCSLAAGPICQSNKVPMISPSSTNPEVTRKGDYVFRMCFVDSYQGEHLASFAVNTLHSRKAAVLADIKSDYSAGLSRFFQSRFKDLGGTIVASASYANGDSDFKSQLTAVKAANPDILFVPGYYADAGRIAIQARALGMQQPLVGGDGWESPKLIETGGKALEGCFFSSHYFAEDPAPVVRGFVARYTKRFGRKPGALAALGYDATMVLAAALKRSATMDGPVLRDEIAGTKSYPGVTGAITFGPDRDPIGKKLVIFEIKNGRLALAATINPKANAASK